MYIYIYIHIKATFMGETESFAPMHAACATIERSVGIVASPRMCTYAIDLSRGGHAEVTLWSCGGHVVVTHSSTCRESERLRERYD